VILIVLTQKRRSVLIKDCAQLRSGPIAKCPSKKCPNNLRSSHQANVISAHTRWSIPPDDWRSHRGPRTCRYGPPGSRPTWNLSDHSTPPPFRSYIYKDPYYYLLPSPAQLSLVVGSEQTYTTSFLNSLVVSRTRNRRLEPLDWIAM